MAHFLRANEFPALLAAICAMMALLLLAPRGVSSSSLSATQTGTSIGSLAKELTLLGIYGSQRAVIVRNNAHDWLRIWCSSADDSTGEKRLNPGEYLSFAFNPLVIGGHTVFWCTLDYKTMWARWDVFGSNAPYGENKYAKAYEYEVRDDGVYYNGDKVRGLSSGQNKYQLWENYDGNKNPHGSSLTGFVDGGKCNNLPGWMEWKVSSVTMCDNACVILKSDLHCRGETSRLQAPASGCSNFWLSFFNDRARSVQGC